MLKGSNESPLRRRTLRNLLVQGVTSFNFATFIRLLLLNSIVSFLLLLALSQFGVPVDSTIMIGRYEFLLPLYVGYLGIGQLAATTILLFKEMGFKEEYKDLVKSILGILTASTLISFATSPLIREQLIDFLATIPVLYFRNSLATSFCLVALMPLTRKVIESAYSRDKITILAIFAMPFLLYWPYFSLISLRTITFDLIGVYLLFMNVIYAGGSLVAGAFIVIIWLSKRGILHDTRLWFIASAAVVCVHLVFLNLFAPVLFEGSPALIPIEILRIVWEYPGWLFGILCTFAGLGIMRIGERTRLLILTGGFLILTLYFANWILLAVSPSALACAGRRDGTARIS